MVVATEPKTIMQQIELLIDARYPLIYIRSYEENRTQAMIDEISIKRNTKLLIWSVTSGIRSSDETMAYEGTEDPVEALKKFRGSKNQLLL